MEDALTKFFGQQSKLIHSDKTQNSSIKLENLEEQDADVAFPQIYASLNQRVRYFNR